MTEEEKQEQPAAEERPELYLEASDTVPVAVGKVLTVYLEKQFKYLPPHWKNVIVSAEAVETYRKKVIAALPEDVDSMPLEERVAVIGKAVKQAVIEVNDYEALIKLSAGIFAGMALAPLIEGGWVENLSSPELLKLTEKLIREELIAQDKNYKKLNLMEFLQTLDNAGLKANNGKEFWGFFSPDKVLEICLGAYFKAVFKDVPDELKALADWNTMIKEEAGVLSCVSPAGSDALEIKDRFRMADALIQWLDDRTLHSFVRNTYDKKPKIKRDKYKSYLTGGDMKVRPGEAVPAGAVVESLVCMDRNIPETDILNYYKTRQGATTLNPIDLISYYVCKAVEADNGTVCEKVKGAGLDDNAAGECKLHYVIYKNVFPLLRDGKSVDEILDRLFIQGAPGEKQPSPSDYAITKTFYNSVANRDEKGCEELPEAEEIICRAVIRNDASICKDVPPTAEDEREKELICKENVYTINSYIKNDGADVMKLPVARSYHAAVMVPTRRKFDGNFCDELFYKLLKTDYCAAPYEARRVVQAAPQ
ncbi:MAG: hypothetical protein AB1742_00745 [bacterium]